MQYMKKKAKSTLLFISALVIMINVYFLVEAEFDPLDYLVSVVYDEETDTHITTYDMSLIPAEAFNGNTTNSKNSINSVMRSIEPFNFPIQLAQSLVSNWDVSINFLYNNVYSEKVLNSGQTVTIEASAANATTSQKNLTLYVAEYQNGVLTAVRTAPKNIYNWGLNDYQNSSINLTLPSTNLQGYSLKAFVWDSATMKPYVESATLTSTATDYYPNTVDDAVYISDMRTLNGKINSASDVDWFKIIPSSGIGSYFIQTTGSTNTKGALYDTDKTTIVSESTGHPSSNTVRNNNFKIGATLEQGKVYYLKVSSENQSTGDYTLSMSKITEPTNAYFWGQYYLLNKGQGYTTQVGSNSNNWIGVSSIIGNDINVLPVWNYTKGNGVKIGIVDGGINTSNPNFTGRISTNPSGRNFVRNNTTIQEEYWHGTEVAGVAASNGYVNGISGVAPESQIVPLIALNSSDSFSDSWVQSAIEYANTNNIGILNLSLQGTNGYSSGLLNTINNVKNNILIIVCAGNHGVNLTNQSRYWLASLNLSNTIIVANSTGNGNLRSGGASMTNSNYGGYTHIAAPGDGILVTYGANNYEWNVGTSFSAPMVSGTAALLKSYYPNLTVEQLKNRIINTNNVSKKPALTGNVSSGGVLNAWLAFSNPQPTTAFSIQMLSEPVFDETRRPEILANMEVAEAESFTNRIIVKFKEDTDKEAIVNSMSPNAVVVNELSLTNSLVLEFDDIEEAISMVLLYNDESSDAVYYAEPDYIIDMNN